MRAGPDVDEDQRPEVDDREPVRIDRPVRRLRQEVVHESEVRRGQEEGHGVMAVPPLHECVLHAGIERVALQERDRVLEGVHDMQHGDGDDRGDVEPDGHVHVALTAFEDRAEHVDDEHHPDEGDQDVDRPLQLGIFLAGRDAQRQGQRGQHDDQLPSPEVDLAEQTAEHRGLAEARERVVDAHEDRVARRMRR